MESSSLINLVIVVAALAVVAGIPFVVIMMSKHRDRMVAESNARRYTGRVDGVVDEISLRAAGKPGFIKVRYEVEGRVYTVRETLKVSAAPREMGQFMVRKRETLCGLAAGSPIEVRYLPDDPSRAILPENVGVLEG